MIGREWNWSMENAKDMHEQGGLTRNGYFVRNTTTDDWVESELLTLQFLLDFPRWSVDNSIQPFFFIVRQTSVEFTPCFVRAGRVFLSVLKFTLNVTLPKIITITDKLLFAIHLIQSIARIEAQGVNTQKKAGNGKKVIEWRPKRKQLHLTILDFTEQKSKRTNQVEKTSRYIENKMNIKNTLSPYGTGGIDINLYTKRPDLEYPDNVVLPSECTDKLRVFSTTSSRVYPSLAPAFHLQSTNYGNRTVLRRSLNAT